MLISSLQLYKSALSINIPIPSWVVIPPSPPFHPSRSFQRPNWTPCAIWRFLISYLLYTWNDVPLQYPCLENLMDRGAWGAAIHGVAKSPHDWATNTYLLRLPWWLSCKKSSYYNAADSWVPSLDKENPLEEEIATHFSILDFPAGSGSKASVYNVGDLRLLLGSGKSPGEGNGNPLQYSHLENPMDRGAW